MAWWEKSPCDVLVATTISGAETIFQEQAEAVKQVFANIPQGLKVAFAKFPEPVIDVSRNKAAQTALNSGARWLWFLDSDILPPPDALAKLIAVDKPIVSALYVRRHNPPFNEMLRLTPQGLRPIQDGEYVPGSLVECDAVATGCLLIRTEVFEKVRPFQLTIDGQPTVGVPSWFLWTESRLNPGMCVLPNQSVFGGSPVETVQVGETIRNGYGQETTVINKFRRPYNGDIVNIVPRGMRLPVKVTPEHNILVLANAQRRSKRGAEGYKYRYWDLDSAEEKWVNAGDLKVGDYVGFPLLEEGKRTSIHIYEESKYAKSRVPFDIDITPELAYLMGLYFAEGSVSGKKSIQFSFSMKETELAKRARDLLIKVFNVNSRIYIGDHALIAASTSHPLGRALLRWFNHDATVKQVPRWILDSDKEIWQHFLRGVFDGDGYVTYNGESKYPMIGCNLATKDGAIQIFALLASLGIRPTFRRYIQPEKSFGHGNPIHVVKILNDFDKTASLLGWDVKDTRTHQQETSFIHNGHLWMKVNAVSREHFEGTVYDLTVGDKNSYVLEGITVHNSEDFSFAVRAKQQGIPIFCHTGVKAGHMGPMKLYPSGNGQPVFRWPGEGAP